jgi:hypothetical protein
VLEEEF